MHSIVNISLYRQLPRSFPPLSSYYPLAVPFLSQSVVTLVVTTGSNRAMYEIIR